METLNGKDKHFGDARGGAVNWCLFINTILQLGIVRSSQGVGLREELAFP